MARFVSREGEVRKEPTLTGSDQQYTNMVVQAFEASRDHYYPWFYRAARWYHLYRGYKQGEVIPFRNNITIPLLFSMAQSEAARIAHLSLSDAAAVEFIAGGPEDQVIARKRTALINAQFEDMDFYDEAIRGLLGGAIFGTSVYGWGWKVEREMVSFRADLGAGEQEFSGEELTFDGPIGRYKNARSIFPQPGVARIRDMRWIVERYHLDLEDINRLADAGFFLKRGAAAVQASPRAPDVHNDDVLAGAENPASGTHERSNYSTDFEKPIEILRYTGRAPRSMNVDGQVNLVVEVAARQHLLRARPNPWGRLPYEEDGPMPDPDHFHRPSMVETCEKLQISSNAMASQKLDALQLAVDPVIAYNSRILPQPRRLLMRPGAFLRFEGPVNDENLRALPLDLRGLVNTYTELEQHVRWMEQGTGIIRDAIQGFSGPDRETARGYLGRQNAANVRVLMAARLFERGVVEKLAMRMVMLNRKFLPFPRQLRMIGTAAMFDPLTMRPVPDETTMMSVNEMLPDYQARAMGSLRGFTKDQNFQKLFSVAQLAQTNPIGLQLTNWVLMFRQLFQEAGVPNPDELLGTDNVVQAAFQQAVAMAAASGQGPNNQQAGSSAGLTGDSSNALPLLGLDVS